MMQAEAHGLNDTCSIRNLVSLTLQRCRVVSS